VHSDPEHLAYLVGLLVLQVWTVGLDELGAPIAARKPILVATSRPGTFAEAYLQLQIPLGDLKRLSNRRRVRLFQTTGKVTNVRNKAEYWDHAIDPDESRTRLHNFFPAAFVAGPHSPPRLVEGRQNLGRGDQGGPAVLIVRRADGHTLQMLQKLFQPILTLLEAALRIEQRSGDGSPVVVWHDSIFDPELDRVNAEQTPVVCLPDRRFERFCAETSLEVIEPSEPADFKKALGDVDGALRALIERTEQGRLRVLVDVYRTALGLRNLLLSLPVGIQRYEQALVVSELHPSLLYRWSVSELFQSLQHRLPEIAALGDWEEFILKELVDGFARLDQLLQRDSPKTEPILSVIRDGLAHGSRVTLVEDSQSFATCLNQVLWMPRPLGFELPRERVKAAASAELGQAGPVQDCIIHRVLDPHRLFPSLAGIRPRRIVLVLSRNELRFVGERFLRTQRLFPQHAANTTILRPIYIHTQSHEDVPALSREKGSRLLSDADFERYMRLFDQGHRSLDRGTVLVEESDRSVEDSAAEVPAYLVALEDDTAVFLQTDSRVSVIRENDALATVTVEHLTQGDRLIVISPAARESIVHRILAARRGEEMERTAGQAIVQWRAELQRGIEAMQVSYTVLLRKIQSLGSRRLTPMVIAQWVRGTVLGPLDAEDIRRLGQAIGSVWLVQNWQRVALALLMVRSGHRLLGRQITRLMQRAALGENELAREDEMFLTHVGITMRELQDAVTLLRVEGVAEEPRLVPSEQIGAVLGMQASAQGV